MTKTLLLVRDVSHAFDMTRATHSLWDVLTLLSMTKVWILILAVLIKLKYCAIYVVFSGFSFSIVVYLVVLRMMWFCALHVREKKEIPALFFNGAGICRVVLFYFL